MTTEPAAGQPPALEPLQPCDLPPRVQHQEVLHAVVSVARVLDEVPRGAYALGSILAALQPQPGATLVPIPPPRQHVLCALNYLGHRFEPAVPGGYEVDTVEISSEMERHSFDLRVMARLLRSGVDPVTVRVAQRLCSWDGVDRWRVHGCLVRLEGAGHLVRHPEARRQPTTVWQVASR